MFAGRSARAAVVVHTSLLRCIDAPYLHRDYLQLIPTVHSPNKQVFPLLLSKHTDHGAVKNAENVKISFVITQTVIVQYLQALLFKPTIHH